MKQPALATVDMFADRGEVGARCFIARVFYRVYFEKMGVVAEAVGFPAYVIVRKEMEGRVCWVPRTRVEAAGQLVQAGELAFL